MKLNSIKNLKIMANDVRKDIIKMLYLAGSGHTGGSLSATDILTTLYFNVMNHDPKNPSWPDRDRFVLSKGHGCPALYAVLARAGYIPMEELKTLRKLNSRLQGHPSKVDLPCLEASTGSLGQGLGMSMGMALGAKLDQKSFRVYCLMGDGEQNEGSVWESAMAAAHYHLDNLVGIIDHNYLQIDGYTKKIMDTDPLGEKYRAFEWHVIKVDGHNFEQLLKAFNDARQVKNKPTLILARTVKGKGVSFMEDKVEWHGKAPDEDETNQALKELAENE